MIFSNLKIVIINPYRGIGDLIFHLPLFKSLNQKYKSKIILLTNSSNRAKELLKNEPYIERIIYIDFTRERQLIKSYNLFKEINNLKPDLCVLTAPSKRLVWPLKFSNSKEKFFFQKNKITDLSQYILKESLQKFKDLNIKKEYNLNYSKNNFKSKSVLLNIDSHHNQNNWAEENYIALANYLLIKKKKLKIYINFSPNNKNLFLKILNEFKSKKNVIFTYKKKFDEVVNIINDCKYIIGNESGPSCIGAALNKKVISIYNPKHTPNLSSKIINNKIIYFNSKREKSANILKKIIKIVS